MKSRASILDLYFSYLREFIAIGILTLLGLLLSSCGPQFNTINSSSNDSQLLSQSINCQQQAQKSSSCLPNKNPVQTAGRSLNQTELNLTLVKPTFITDLDNSGYLQSANIVVSTSRSPRAQSDKNGQWKFQFQSNTSDLEQVNAYSVAQSFINWAKGKYPDISSNKVLIIADSSFTGYLPTKNEIHLEKNSNQLPMALDGGSIVALITESLAANLSLKASHANLSTSTIPCKNSKGAIEYAGCCSSQSGCAKAVLSGVADYLQAAFFVQDSTAILQSWQNDISGQSICGVRRNPAINSPNSLSSAFKACVDKGRSGQVQVMGQALSSALWQIRTKLINKDEFDALLLNSLSSISGSDSIIDYWNKLITLDSSRFAGKFQSQLKTGLSSLSQ